jgi:hypothetical protein
MWVLEQENEKVESDYWIEHRQNTDSGDGNKDANGSKICDSEDLKVRETRCGVGYMHR